jgi:hypothetical protein
MKQHSHLLLQSVKDGKIGQYTIAQVVYSMFEDKWTYSPQTGWRVLVMSCMLTGDEALMHVKTKISEDVAHLYTNFASTNPGIYETSANEIALYLKNHTFKNEVVEEAALLFAHA